jgi:hypothetical protein
MTKNRGISMRHRYDFGCAFFSGLAATIFLPNLAMAQCGAETLFSCQTGGKIVEVCLDGDTVSYAFGPKNKPDMEISTPLTELSYRPWNGIGSMMSDAVQFTNGDYSYEVWAGIQKMNDETAPAPEWSGGVNILKGEDLVAYLDCDTIPDVYQLDSLNDLKQAAGQCFDFDSQSWKTQCNN